MNKKYKLKLLTLIPVIFFSVSGGPYGLEEIVTSVGPFNTLFLVLILPIIWTIPETMIVAELSSNYPVKGGYYRWVEMSLGRFWGFMEGWFSILYTLIDLSLYPILFTAYLKYFFCDLNFWEVYLIQILVIWISAFLNIVGIKLVGNVLTLFQLFIVFFFIIFIVFGCNYLSWDCLLKIKTAHSFSGNNVLFGLSLAFWNYIGWDNGSTVLHEVHEPEINYHKALFYTIPIVVLMYFFPLLVGIAIHPNWHEWKFGEFSHIANSINHPILALFLAIGGMVTCLGLFNSLLLSSSRVFSTMAEDKLFPESFAKNHKVFNTPYVAIIFASFVYSIFVLIDFNNLIIYDVFLYLIAMFLEAIALVVLRRKNGIKSNFNIPFGDFGLYFVVGLALSVILFMVLINVFILRHSMHHLLYVIFPVISGIPIYLFYTTRHKC